MSNLKQLLEQRMQKTQESSKKMHNLAQRSSTGDLSGFSGVFKVTPLTEKEHESLQEILSLYKPEEKDSTQQDLNDLITLTSEVKAIHNQSILLHGERIKKAQDLLKSYKEGAFSSWLIATYGNRQTPYNFLQYYEFYLQASDELREKIDLMPKQAIYTLASRSGEEEKKTKFIENYQGETKKILLKQIRELFPLPIEDRRKKSLAGLVLKNLQDVLQEMQSPDFKPTSEQKKHFLKLLSTLKTHV